MPVEIRELQITAVVQDTASPHVSGSVATSSSNNDEIIAACVEQVMEILTQKAER